MALNWKKRVLIYEIQNEKTERNKPDSGISKRKKQREAPEELESFSERDNIRESETDEKSEEDDFVIEERHQETSGYPRKKVHSSSGPRYIEEREFSKDCKSHLLFGNCSIPSCRFIHRDFKEIKDLWKLREFIRRYESEIIDAIDSGESTELIRRAYRESKREKRRHYNDYKDSHHGYKESHSNYNKETHYDNKDSHHDYKESHNGEFKPRNRDEGEVEVRKSEIGPKRPPPPSYSPVEGNRSPRFERGVFSAKESVTELGYHQGGALKSEKGQGMSGQHENFRRGEFGNQNRNNQWEREFNGGHHEGNFRNVPNYFQKQRPESDFNGYQGDKKNNGNGFGFINRMGANPPTFQGQEQQRQIVQNHNSPFFPNRPSQIGQPNSFVPNQIGPSIPRESPFYPQMASNGHQIPLGDPQRNMMNPPPSFSPYPTQIPPGTNIPQGPNPYGFLHQNNNSNFGFQHQGGPNGPANPQQILQNRWEGPPQSQYPNPHVNIQPNPYPNGLFNHHLSQMNQRLIPSPILQPIMSSAATQQVPPPGLNPLNFLNQIPANPHLNPYNAACLQQMPSPAPINPSLYNIPAYPNPQKINEPLKIKAQAPSPLEKANLLSELSRKARPLSPIPMNSSTIKEAEKKKSDEEAQELARVSAESVLNLMKNKALVYSMTEKDMVAFLKENKVLVAFEEKNPLLKEVFSDGPVPIRRPEEPKNEVLVPKTPEEIEKDLRKRKINEKFEKLRSQNAGKTSVESEKKPAEAS